MITNFTSIDQLPITLSAEQVAQVLGISRAGALRCEAVQAIPIWAMSLKMIPNPPTVSATALTAHPCGSFPMTKWKPKAMDI